MITSRPKVFQKISVLETLPVTMLSRIIFPGQLSIILLNNIYLVFNKLSKNLFALIPFLSTSLSIFRSHRPNFGETITPVELVNYRLCLTSGTSGFALSSPYDVIKSGFNILAKLRLNMV